MLETILVIDDDSEATQSMAHMLESKDYLVFSADNEATALALAGKINPGLIFVSPAVSGGRGLEICKSIHSTEQLRSVPIIALSAFEGAKDPHFTSLYGIVDSIQKPPDPEDLLSKINNVLSMTPSAVQPAVEIAAGGEEAPEETVDFAEALTEGERSETPDPEQSELSPEREIAAERPGPYVPKRMSRSAGVKTKLPVALVAAVAIVVLGALGFMLYYKGSLFESQPRKTVTPGGSLSSQQAAPVNPLPVPETRRPDSKEEPARKSGTAAPHPVAPVKQPEASTPSPSTSAPVQEARSKVAAPSAEKPEASQRRSGKTVYSVQIGAFKSRKNASALAQKYGKKGYESFTHKSSTGNNGVLYRVLIGKFGSRREAADWAKRVISEEHIKTTIFRR